MHELMPERLDVRITQTPGRVTWKMLDGVDQLLLILPRRPPRALWRELPGGTKLEPLLKRRRPLNPVALQARLDNKRQTLVVAGTIKRSAAAFDQLTLARRLVAAATHEKAGVVGVCVLGFEGAVRDALYRATVAAIQAAAFALPQFRSRPRPPRIRSAKLLGHDERIDLDRTTAEAAGNNLARWLTALPPNKLDARAYANLTSDLAGAEGWDYRRYGVKELAKLGAGAFLAVAQGNEDESAAIVRLRYRPVAKKAAPDLALVGKGIIFDTGGTNLKPFSAMLDMHGDMQGSAVALGTLLAISRLGLPLAVDCWLAITENRTGPRAYKSQDLVTAANGKTIQTIHTDAEGRMALADTLVFASREKPRLIVDYATLTGSVINAITTRMSGVFTNRPDWHPRLKRTGRDAGERVWPFPIDKEFLVELRSDVADIKQCSPKPSADHILAGCFLAEFVENDVPWVHIDLAASENEGGLGHVPTKVTGFGVRYTLALLLDDRILEAGD
ncbi:MAG: M17 family metallopeptidase [Woeseiaceae bacterium]|nr:M17 family metallopeptidase [Woeseiaceae bacterium]